MATNTAGVGCLGRRPPASPCVAGRSRGGAVGLREPAIPPRERGRQQVWPPFARPQGDSRPSRF